MENWNGSYWNTILEWATGMEYWNGGMKLYWNGGMAEWNTEIHDGDWNGGHGILEQQQQQPKIPAFKNSTPSGLLITINSCNPFHNFPIPPTLESLCFACASWLMSPNPHAHKQTSTLFQPHSFSRSLSPTCSLSQALWPYLFMISYDQTSWPFLASLIAFIGCFRLGSSLKAFLCPSPPHALFHARFKPYSLT